MATQRLKKGAITLQHVYILSRHYYQTKQVDNKKERSKLDIISGKITQKNNFQYDRSSKQWKQTGRETKITFTVSSNPVSYKKTDTVPIHKYPVYFIFKDISLGIASPFRWRTGGFKNPKFPKKGISKEKRLKITNQNIKDGNQMQFFFNIEFVSKLYGTLYGACRAKWAPKKTNPQMILYFDKTAYFVVEKILIPFLNSGKGIQLNKSIQNK